MDQENGVKKVHLVAQELKLARVLAGNSKTSRDRALKNLTKWFKQRSETIPFTEDDFLRIWKGLFYSMWMSDKPLIQEECAENISKLVHLPTLEASMLFFKAGLQTLANEWFGIDQLRLDKFLMFTRRLLRQALVVLKENHFNKRSVVEFCGVISQTILNVDKKAPLGLFMHFTEIYLEELAKISNGQLNPEFTTEFLKPFINKLAISNDGRDIAHIRKFIFTYLIRQHDLGLEYQEKYKAWKREGFPGSINSMQKVPVIEEEAEESVEEDEEEEAKNEEKTKPLDPRAGRVDVELPQIKFNPNHVAKALLEVKFDSRSTTKARKIITVLAEQFQKLGKGVYPLGVKQVLTPKEEDFDMSIRKAVNRLVKFDKKIMGKKRKNKGQEPAKKRPKLEVEEESMEDQIRMSEEKLFEQIKEKNAAKLKKKKRGIEKPIKKSKNRLGKQLDEKVDCVFKRNSGTWVVFKTEEEVTSRLGDAGLGCFLEGKLEADEKPTTGQSPQKRPSPEKLQTPEGSPAAKRRSIDIQPVNLFKVPPQPQSPKSSPKQSPKTDNCPKTSPKSSPKNTELFPKSEWDEPLKEGEIELVIPAKKYINKLKEKSTNKESIQDLVNQTISKIKGKSQKSHVFKTPKTAKLSSPNSSSKKVKINTKLNQSQEIYEHVAQLKNSPGIPYDANKKPSKPLLKPTGSTPINPFYKQTRWF